MTYIVWGLGASVPEAHPLQGHAVGDVGGGRDAVGELAGVGERPLQLLGQPSRLEIGGALGVLARGLVAAELVVGVEAEADEIHPSVTPDARLGFETVLRARLGDVFWGRRRAVAEEVGANPEAAVDLGVRRVGSREKGRLREDACALAGVELDAARLVGRGGPIEFRDRFVPVGVVRRQERGE